jgi:transcriptional regulator with XRE-family HTH domain
MATNHSDPPTPPLAVHDWRFAVSALMDEQGVNKTELAAAAGVSKGRVTQLLTADNLTIRSMARVARALGYQLRVELHEITEME